MAQLDYIPAMAGWVLSAAAFAAVVVADNYDAFVVAGAAAAVVAVVVVGNSVIVVGVVGAVVAATLGDEVLVILPEAVAPFARLIDKHLRQAWDPGFGFHN